MSPSDPSSRRNFLRGRFGREMPTREDEPAVGPLSPIIDPARQRYLMSVSRRAMACQWQAYFNAGQYEQAELASMAALDLVDQLEAQLTIFREDSEVSQLNQLAADEPVEVQENLFELLDRSQDLAEQTGGAFDITSGPLSEVWGFARREGRVPEPNELAATLEHVGSHLLELDDDGGTVFFRDEQLEINLGGIGKGYALDCAADKIEEEAVFDFLLHGGQSSVVARGRNADRDTGWAVGLVHPLNPKQRLAEIVLVDQALSTSGSGTQFITHRGRRLGHILNPKTGWPAEGVLSATVITESAAEADALSTAMFVMGPEAARDFCQGRPDVGVALVLPGERSGSVVIESHNLSDDQWRRLDG